MIRRSRGFCHDCRTRSSRLPSGIVLTYFRQRGHFGIPLEQGLVPSRYACASSLTFPLSVSAASTATASRMPAPTSSTVP